MTDQSAILADDAPRIVSVDAIKRAVCSHFGVSGVDLVSDRRARRIARPRQVAMYFANEFTTLSLPAIGRLFGHRDHTTVMHAIKVVRERQANLSFARELDQIADVLMTPDRVTGA